MQTKSGRVLEVDIDARDDPRSAMKGVQTALLEKHISLVDMYVLYADIAC